MGSIVKPRSPPCNVGQCRVGQAHADPPDCPVRNSGKRHRRNLLWLRHPDSKLSGPPERRRRCYPSAHPTLPDLKHFFR